MKVAVLPVHYKQCPSVRYRRNCSWQSHSFDGEFTMGGFFILFKLFFSFLPIGYRKSSRNTVRYLISLRRMVKPQKTTTRQYYRLRSTAGGDLGSAVLIRPSLYGTLLTIFWLSTCAHLCLTLDDLGGNGTTSDEGGRSPTTAEDDNVVYCPPEKFACADKRQCVARLYVCDGSDDCRDGSDETVRYGSCYSKAKPCEAAEFDCGEKCIPAKWVCDKETDCKSKADEDPSICSHFECKPDQFTCHGNTSSCIPLNWVCDNKTDCDDGSDEISCNATCTSEQFTCATSKCIPVIWHCDGDNDCGDESDEKGCPIKDCNNHEVECPDTTCIQRSWVCDGTTDCADGWDEHNCENSTTISECSDLEIKCDRSFVCIDKNFLCDGDRDCPEGDDEGERYCSKAACPGGTFMCTDTSCIPNELRCNGFTECVDGSDEKNCSLTGCNPQYEFDCGDHCIPMSLVCNGQEDCGDGKDELSKVICDRNECNEHNGGCSQLCVDTKAGYYCACKSGFMLNDGPHGTFCIDINECLEPGICSQICCNLKGTFKCECVEGYAKDPHDITKCKAMEGHASLLFADYYDIRKISLDHQEVTAIVNETAGSAALDFVFKTGMIFWTDARDRCIYKAPIDEGLKKEVVIKGDMTNTDGLAVDWLYNHIYWTNSDNNTVEVADFNGNMRKSLYQKDLREPRAIAIYPIEGWMFWTDWGADPKIERAGMDGSYRETIVSRDIKWPNGLTIDYVLRKIYWVDSKRHSVSTCDFDGTNRRVILYSKEHLPHPFSITVFEDTIYWTDWSKQAILQATKFSGENLQIVSYSHSSPMTVHVYHSYRQPNGTNHCTPLNGLCSHLCLPAPQFNASTPKTSCVCPNGHELMNDGLTCERPGKKSSHRHPEATVPELVLNDDPNVATRELILGSGLNNRQGFATSDMDDDSSSIVPPDDNDDGSVAVAAILAAIVILCLTSVLAYLIYRYYRKRSVHSMNFDNPVYKKTTTEDGFNMAGDHRGGGTSSSQNGLKSATHQQSHRQYGVMSSEETLEPLTRNHQCV